MRVSINEGISVIEYHDPKAKSEVQQFPYELSIKLKGSNQVTIGLLANGFPDSENFLNKIAEVIRADEPGITIKSYNKGNASVPASDDMLGEIERDCQAVITAYGH
jgi:hypothetical protein